MNTLSSFKVNQVRAIQTNIQYTVSISGDALYFIKTGGQFADFKHLLVHFTSMLIGGLLFGILGGLYINEDLVMLFIAIGFALGIAAGSFIRKRYMSPANKNEQVTGINSLSPEELLLENKCNFRVPFSEISRIVVNNSPSGMNGPRAGTLNILGKSYDIAPGQQFEEISSELERALPGKIVDTSNL